MKHGELTEQWGHLTSGIHGFDMVSSWNILDKTERYSKLVYDL